MSRSDEDRRRAPRSRWRPLLWGIVLSLLFGGGSLVAWAWLARPTAAVSRASAIADTRPGVGVLEKLDVYGHVPDFSLIERSGRRVGRSDLLGKIWVVDFFYTRCTDTCPLQSAHMARLQADLSGQRDVRLVSISINPEHDTPKVLIAYARRFRADPDRWLFLTGSRAAIYQLAVDGFHLGVAESGRTAQQAKGGGWARLGPARSGARSAPNGQRIRLLHSSRFVLVDRQGQIRGYYEGTDRDALTRLRANLEILLHNGEGGRP